MRSEDTIVAASSPPGRSHRGLIRITGPNAIAILESITEQQADTTHTLAVRRLRLQKHALPVLVSHFRGPRSFTGEDIVELQLPGNAALLDRVLHLIYDKGARLAEPGEFTFRAFTAGKLDLTQAEGIAATISATSDSQLRAATLLRDGTLGSWSTKLVDELATALALTEAGIDFVDQDDVVPIRPGELDAQFVQLEQTLQELLSRARSWSELAALPWVVLAGEPSAGKSTLFNALLGRERAVIDALPGTTRDALSEPLRWTDRQGKTVEVMLVDVAGLEDAASQLDREAQGAAQRAIDRAELVINVLDATGHAKSIAGALLVETKCDIADAHRAGSLCISAVTGAGLDALRQAIAERLAERAVSLSGEALALQARHETALRQCLTHLHEARQLLANQLEGDALNHIELIAGCGRAALDELAGLGGRMSPDDVIGRVFATFCVGK